MLKWCGIAVVVLCAVGILLVSDWASEMLESVSRAAEGE